MYWPSSPDPAGTTTLAATGPATNGAAICWWAKKGWAKAGAARVRVARIVLAGRTTFPAEATATTAKATAKLYKYTVMKVEIAASFWTYECVHVAGVGT
jgi:hypothetical protein